MGRTKATVRTKTVRIFQSLLHVVSFPKLTEAWTLGGTDADSLTVTSVPL